MLKKQKIVRDNLKLIYGSICFLLSLFPFPFLYFLSDILFYPFYYVIKYRRKIVRKNLIESFPKKKLSEIIKIEKCFYHFFLDCFFEICKMMTLSKKEIGKRMKFINLNLLNEPFNQGKSISLYMGHYCNWEWVSSMAMHFDQSIVTGQIYRKINHIAFNQLMLTIRSRFGAYNIEMEKVARWLKSMKNKKTIVGYIADQTPPWNNVHHWVTFLHHDTPAFTGAERIIKKNHSEAYFLYIQREKRGFYKAKLIKLIEPTCSVQTYPLTNLYFEYLERMILHHPEYYLWTHNRFKRTRKEYNKRNLHKIKNLQILTK